MKLKDLLSGCTARSITGDLDTDVLGLAYDSRQVSRGSAFIAIRGLQADGNRFVPQAIAKGAAVVVSSSAPIDAIAMPWVQVDDEREALATLASNFYERPTEHLHLVGITGTNGKTTTTYLVESILKAAGHPTAIMGTIEYRGPGFEKSAERTTPEAPDLESLFRQVVQAEWQFAVMEVSSHAIELKRVSRLHFEIAVFTNLSRDHLDFHGDMESYFAAKKKLFQRSGSAGPRVMVLNFDDPRYDELQSIDPSRVISYGIESASHIFPIRHQFDWEGTVATYKTPLGDMDIRSALVGRPNLYNIGAAIGTAISLNVPSDAIREGIQELSNVPGRFQLIHAGQPFRVIVDYAHTDDALDKALTSAREITSGKLIVVFGCGGDRDRTKRPLMGEVAARRSDYAIITSDNPRSEDPAAIIDQVEDGFKAAGVQRGSAYTVCIDRREAIRQALESARSGDTVLIAGKGHEAYQTIGDQTFDFDDRVVARGLLDELVARRNF